MIEWEVKEHKLSPFDIYHENHPFHFLVLDEEEAWDEWMKNYEEEQGK